MLIVYTCTSFRYDKWKYKCRRHYIVWPRDHEMASLKYKFVTDVHNLMEGNRTSAGTYIWHCYKYNFVINFFVIGEVYCICVSFVFKKVLQHIWIRSRCHAENNLPDQICQSPLLGIKSSNPNEFSHIRYKKNDTLLLSKLICISVQLHIQIHRWRIVNQ